MFKKIALSSLVLAVSMASATVGAKADMHDGMMMKKHMMSKHDRMMRDRMMHKRMMMKNHKMMKHTM